MDDDDIYGSILSEPKSISNSSIATRINDNNSEINQSTSSNASNTINYNYTGPFSNISPQASLFLSNLSWWTSEEDLRHIFGELSTRIKELQFLEHKPNGKSKGMVIIEFMDVATAEMARNLIEGKEINGRVCEASFARSPPVKPYERTPHYYQNQTQHQMPRDQFNPRGGGYRPPTNFHARPDQSQGYVQPKPQPHSLSHPQQQQQAQHQIHPNSYAKHLRQDSRSMDYNRADQAQPHQSEHKNRYDAHGRPVHRPVNYEIKYQEDDKKQYSYPYPTASREYLSNEHESSDRIRPDDSHPYVSSYNSESNDHRSTSRYSREVRSRSPDRRSSANIQRNNNNSNYNQRY